MHGKSEILNFQNNPRVDCFIQNNPRMYHISFGDGGSRKLVAESDAQGNAGMDL